MMKDIREAILRWFRENKRDLPWRSTHDPYLIWLSEVILQQTRIEQGLPYYHRFVERFPTIQDLASAEESEVLKLWQGLGYYNRARNLHYTAKTIVNHYNSEFPKDFNELKKLKGIGDYTASAVASMAFDLPHAVVDGNVNRVLARIFGIKKATNSTAGQKIFKKTAQDLLDDDNPGTFNEAIMDFGAIQCMAANPHCLICPLQSYCYAFQENVIQQLPYKAPKSQKRTRYFHYLVLPLNEGIWLKKRTEKDIWENLYDFPLIETKEDVYIGKAMLQEHLSTNLTPEWMGEYRHTLTHQNIIGRFYKLKRLNNTKKSANYTFASWKELYLYPFPRLIEKFFQKNFPNSIKN